jgi:hypothetical protein
MSATSQYDPNKLGWGAALATCVFTAALGFTAYTIHKNTYRHPRDPMNVQVYHERDAAKHSEAAPAEHKAEGAAPAAEAAPAAAGEAKH